MGARYTVNGPYFSRRTPKYENARGYRFNSTPTLSNLHLYICRLFCYKMELASLVFEHTWLARQRE